MSLCCGREVSVPSDPEEVRYVLETEDGTPITIEEFPDAELVCPGCERTWPQGCQHQNIEFKTKNDTATINDGVVMSEVHCLDCEETVVVRLEITDAMTTEEFNNVTQG